MVPALWDRFWTDGEYQEVVMRQLVPRAKTLVDLATQLIPYIARPIWA